MILIVIFLFFFFLFQFFAFILFRNSMCKEVCACYIWIVNDMTDCNTCLFSVSGFFLLFYFEIVCVRLCVRERESLFLCLHDYIVRKCFISC